MNRFMIGHHDRFDEKKQSRDFRDDFFGIEVCLIESEDDIKKIKNNSDERNYKIGIHFPLRAKQWRLRDPQYLSKDIAVQSESYKYMENEFEYSKHLNPHYILLHFPKPVILDDSVDWTNWRFADRTEYYYESEYRFEEFKNNSEQFFRWYEEKGKKYNFIPILELDGVNNYIYSTDLLEHLLERHPGIKLCLDIGRIHLQDMIDPNFKGYEFVEKYSKYAELIHLWNVKINTNLTHSHFPVLPSQRAEEGWADIKKYITIINSNNSNYKVLFEHRSDLISDEELNTCYQWISEMI